MWFFFTDKYNLAYLIMLHNIIFLTKNTDIQTIYTWIIWQMAQATQFLLLLILRYTVSKPDWHSNALKN